MESRIKFDMSIGETLHVMAEGNPGAISVMMKLIKETAAIDPDAAMPEIINLLSLDDLGVYGPRIWMLYKDVCGEDIRKVIGLLRARQLGSLLGADLNFAIDNMGEGVDVDAMMAEVQKELSNFKGER